MLLGVSHCRREGAKTKVSLNVQVFQAISNPSDCCKAVATWSIDCVRRDTRNAKIKRAWLAVVLQLYPKWSKLRATR